MGGRSAQAIADGTVVRVKEEFKGNYQGQKLHTQILYVTRISGGNTIAKLSVVGKDEYDSYGIKVEHLEIVKVLGYTVKTWGYSVNLKAYGKDFRKDNLEQLEAALQAKIDYVEANELKKGQAMVVYRVAHRGDDIENATRIAIIKIKSVGKSTYTLDNKTQFSKFTYEGEIETGCFSNHKQYDFKSKYIKCDISGEIFHPEHGFVYSEKKYNEIAKYVQEKHDKDVARNNRYDDLEETKKPFVDYSRELNKKMQLKLRDKYIETMCSSCANYKVDGTCKRDDDFFRAGELAKTNSMFWGGSSMCSWERKREVK